METPKNGGALPVLPDASLHNPEPNYIRGLIERAGLTQRAAARLVGIDERSMRYQLNGDREIPYTTQYCLEVLARGGVADTPLAPPVWFKTAQRPLRKDDAGRIVVGKVAGLYVLGRVAVDGYGVKIDTLPGDGVGSREIRAGALTDYVLVDDSDG